MWERTICFVLIETYFSLNWTILLTKEYIDNKKSLVDKRFYLELDLLLIKTLKLNTV